MIIFFRAFRISFSYFEFIIFSSNIPLDKEVTGFSNQEEDAIQLTKEVPYSLEDRLKANGGIYRNFLSFISHPHNRQVFVCG